MNIFSFITPTETSLKKDREIPEVYKNKYKSTTDALTKWLNGQKAKQLNDKKLNDQRTKWLND